MNPLSWYWRSESAQFDLIMNVCGYSIIVLLHRPCRKQRGGVAFTAHQRAKQQVCTTPEAPNGPKATFTSLCQRNPNAYVITADPAMELAWWSRWGGVQRGIALLTSEQTVAVVGEGVKDAVGCHDTEAQVVQSPSLQSGDAEFGQERRKTEVKRTESRQDEKFWSSEMARNRESVCDHHRNPELQACTERSSHQETFEKKETEQLRAFAAAELVSAGVTGTHQGRR